MPFAVEDKPAVQTLFQRLERIEADMEGAVHTGHNRWMIPYADLLTLLLGLFLVILASGQVKTEMVMPKKPVVQATLQQTGNKHPSDLTTIQQRLQDKLKLKGVEIRQQKGVGLVVSVKDSILFTPGSAELSPEAGQTLDRVIEELKTSLGPMLHSIRVEGHTDDTPIRTAKFPSNWELSTARATNIVRYMVSRAAFPPERLSAAGYAEFKPLGDNSTIEGKQKNRRVDIVVLRPSVVASGPLDDDIGKRVGGRRNPE
jgi:chemotaxis protein MotB